MSNRRIQAYQLDPYCLPLYGQRLIEASAGTGKTYTIALLYLRLLLGVGQKNAFSRPLSVEEILVVTFTEVATDELRSRIRHNIHQMRMACIRDGIGFDENSIFRILLSSIADKEVAAQWLLAAERQMDEAAIYTIHGFCQRMLVHNAFESGMLFEQSIIKDEHTIQKQACADFWRCNCYPLNYSISKVIVDEWSDPEALLAEIKPYLQGDIPNFVNQSIEAQSIKQRHQTLIDTIKKVKELWLLNSASFIDLITDSAINKRSYSRRNLPGWIAAVTGWAQSATVDYKTPKELARFCQSQLIDKTPTGQVPEHEVFLAIDNLMQQSLTLRDIIISKAIIDVRQTIVKEKRRRGEIGFDDLLSHLDQALHAEGGERLSNTIRNRYPVVMVDEFQDTDPQQYRIFQRIYQGHNHCGLLFIGDPKQAIYAFRGADIFTYLKAKDQIESHYTLDTNWRSSPSMVAAINQLFSRATKPFLFEQIPFNTVDSASSNQHLAFIHKTAKLSALNFCYLDKEAVSTLDYQQTMAYQCASQICDWLKGGENGTTWLYRNDVKQPVTAADIMVLVRSRREAVMIREALSKFNISSVFLSNQESVFATDEARDLLWLLQAVLSPEKERTLRCALATRLIGLSAQDIEQLNQDENQWEIRVEEFANYLLIWQRHGILPALRAIMVNHRIAENLLMDNIDGERRLMDVMHLSELLQEAELQLESEHALVRWLAQQIDHPDPLVENQQIRLESDSHLVSISTIHKSKGLEFPIVWLPFACQFSQQKLATFHDRDNFQTCLDLTQQEESIRLANEERLAEDLRLLYVALTRSKYHCSVGIAPLIKGRPSGESGNTDLHQSALGYLLQNGQPGNATLLRDALGALASENISITPVSDINLSPWYPKENTPVKLLARNFTGQIQNTWRVTSYSGLTYHDMYSDKFTASDISIEIAIQDLAPKMDVDAQGDSSLVQGEIAEWSVHTFPKGATAGTFLHSLLELLPFNQHPQESWLAEKLEQAGFSADWAPVLKMWLINIFDTPLLSDSLSLSKITPENQLNEMQFHLPIEKLLLPSALDRLTHQYDVLSQRCPPLSFEPVTGVLKGYIDLVFCWQDKFYLLDYKSNWLGENGLAYSQEAIQNAMIDHRYDLQYQLYTLAMHRYLRNRLPNYDYQKHFGGVIYLFLRGFDAKNPGYGIYHTIPPYAFINSLDELFNATNRGEQ
ncbi:MULTISPECIES: exodeoxyribonuclease V subunit beta [unclassified Arsenophonus]|uniref:exodeoxyribonuclease V subunit beta n=1 Tax=unclassified Arsenophonus TaxID=2627083 RepID=UPI002862A6FF|nr:exodeoxyribonuclease V subunit beta [Arsenophonus sp.]MDR5609145.1 exodeoxyribonuclease V subunit beta [Arsenophonus sp.]MDR5612877.1 exodeoxyribonuclease V subunit beta [Arsenophonus sp.]